MSFRGTGMLCVWTDIPPHIEPEFNRWYDREHLAERVAIPGFTRACRYVLTEPQAGAAKYLALYEAESIDVLNSPDYHVRLKNQTEWSRKIMARFVKPSRACVRVVSSKGAGIGGALAILRFEAPGTEAGPHPEFVQDLTGRLDRALAASGVVGCHLLVTDAAVSAVGALGSPPSARQTIAVVEADTPADARSALANLCVAADLPGVPATYRLMVALSR